MDLSLDLSSIWFALNSIAYPLCQQGITVFLYSDKQRIPLDLAVLSLLRFLKQAPISPDPLIFFAPATIAVGLCLSLMTQVQHGGQTSTHKRPDGRMRWQ